MTVRTRGLDTKAKSAIFVAVALLLAGPIILVAKHVTTKLQEAGQAAPRDDDRLILLKDGSTMLARHGSTARIIANWLNEAAAGAKTFEVGNENFSPNSASLTHAGWEHLAQFSQMLRAHHDVDAVVLYSAHHGVTASTALEHLRADRIRDEALRQGVGQDQISVSKESFEVGHNAAADEGLEVVLTNKA